MGGCLFEIIRGLIIIAMMVIGIVSVCLNCIMDMLLG